MSPDDPGFAARRLAARERLNTIDDAGDPYRRVWFEKVYELAGNDPAQVPWADLAPHPLLADWLAREAAPPAGARALDVGSGLGDNAAALAAKGFRVTGFDLSVIAVTWAARRFPQIEFATADLFAPPAAWIGAFDLVHECYTVQAMPPGARGDAMAAIARFVAPGGRLLVIARMREAATPVAGPPWPLSAEELLGFVTHGLTTESVEQLPNPDDGRQHWRAVFRCA
jgi:SAM-dependent methyltransferase